MWLVHSQRDIDTCRKILRSKNIRDFDAQFRTLNPDDFEVESGRATEQSILDVIEIDHPNPDCARYIRNYLVDASSLNEVRLTETFAQAQAVVNRPLEEIKLSNGVRHQLRRKCYSLNNARTGVERVQTASKTGGIQSVFVYGNRANPYEADVSGQKNQVCT